MNDNLGYLKEDFKFFHIKDKNKIDFDFHFHNFNKIIIFLSGDVTYNIEGKSYVLNPYDILLINEGDIHKPIINPNYTYDRIIIWCNSDFLNNHNFDNYDLNMCFKHSIESRINLIRLNNSLKNKLNYILSNLEESTTSTNFASKLLSNSYFIQLIIYINRIYINNNLINEKTSYKYNKEIEEILKYINKNLSSDLSIENLSDKFYINKYYLMHKFKEATGFTLHKYIIEKRLIKAKKLITNGFPIIKASKECGFNDYSSFLRSFKKYFNFTPNALQ